MQRKNRGGWVVGLATLVMVLALGLGYALKPAQAADSVRLYEAANHVGYFVDSSVGIHTSAENVDFAAAGFAGNPGYVKRVRVFNDDSTNNLLVKLIPYGTSMPTGALTTPSNATATEVLDLKPGDDGAVGFPVEGKFRGLRWQSKTAAGAARVFVEY